MTTLTYPTNTIMCYPVTGSTFSTYDVNSCAVFWAGTKVYFTVTGAGAAGGLRQFNIDPDGLETLSKTATAMGRTGVSGDNNFEISRDGNYLYGLLETTPQNSSPIMRVDAATLTYINTLGALSGTLAIGTKTRFGKPIHTVAADDFIMMNNMTGLNTQNDANIFALDAAVNGNVTQGTGDIAVGQGGYFLQLAFQNGISGANNTQPITLCKATIGAVVSPSFTSIGSFSPANIDPTWTKVITLKTMAVDQTDGHLVMTAQTNEAVATPTRIFKISHNDGHVIWSVALTLSPTYNITMSHSRIQNGKFYIPQTDGIVVVDTILGSKTTTSFPGLVLNGFWVSDDVTNSVIYRGNFTVTGSAANFVGNYMGTLGNHTFVNNIGRAWLATAPSGGGGGSGSATTLQFSFADFTNETTWKDWTDATVAQVGVDYSAYLRTFFHFSNDDMMYWMQAPYLYSYVLYDAGTTEDCTMQAAWDWAENSSSHQFSTAQSIYRNPRTNHSVTINRSKILGRGRVVSLRFDGVTGKGFRLLGWGMDVVKSTNP
jgi:hypothetical protein